MGKMRMGASPTDPRKELLSELERRGHRFEGWPDIGPALHPQNAMNRIEGLDEDEWGFHLPV